MLFPMRRAVLWASWLSAVASALPLCILDERSSAAKDVQKDLQFHLQTPILRIEGTDNKPHVLLNEISPQQSSRDQKLDASDHDPTMQPDYISVYSQSEKAAPANQSPKPLTKYCYRYHLSHKTRGPGTNARGHSKRSWMMPYLLALYVVAGLVTLVALQAALLHMVGLVMRLFGYQMD